MDDGFIVSPACLQIVGFVLGESAIVKNTELASCGRIGEWNWFSTIVESCPVEKSHKPGTCSIKLHATFYSVVCTVCIGKTVPAGHPSAGVCQPEQVVFVLLGVCSIIFRR